MGESKQFREEHAMFSLYLPFFLALLILAIPKESVASGMLAELREVAINVAVGEV